MKVTLTVDSSALTASGTGKESFRVSMTPKDWVEVTLYESSFRRDGPQVVVRMDRSTATYLALALTEALR